MINELCETLRAPHYIGHLVKRLILKIVKRLKNDDADETLIHAVASPLPLPFSPQAPSFAIFVCAQSITGFEWRKKSSTAKRIGKMARKKIARRVHSTLGRLCNLA